MNLDDIKARCDEVGDCWIWRGAMQGGSVPAMRLSGPENPDKTTVSVRRWIAANIGKKINGLLVTVSCQDKRCVCPDHLQVIPRKILGIRIGKSIRKSQTPARKQAYISARIKAGMTKLDMDTVRLIRTEDKSPQLWASEIGCDVSSIHRAKRGDTWKEHSGPFAGLMG